MYAWKPGGGKLKRITAMFLALVMVLSMIPLSGYVSAMYGTKIVDGHLTDWTTSDLIATGRNSGLAGANLDGLYVAWDDEYLYIALKTNNTASWDVAYGIGIDVDPGSGKGYTGGSNPSDSWGRKIGFGNGFAIDYEIYFWWSGSEGKITSNNFNVWTGNGWEYMGVSDVNGTFTYLGNSSTGLRTIEIKIPWSALGGRPEKMALTAWVAGGDGSSAVDSIPVDPTIDYSNINSEWTDSDTFTNLAMVYPSPKTIDGNLSDWGQSDLIVTGKDNGQAGANLEKMYISWDDKYLYIALKTNNTASWDVAYGFGIDVNPGSGKGYTGGSNPSDSWGRKVGFGNGFAIDYEIYFWWSGSEGKITSDNFNVWTGNGWSYSSFSDVGAKFAYLGNSSTGLKTLEIAIPWSALGGKHTKFAVMAWIAGGGGSSAVDSIPVDPAIDYNNIGSEWSDTDVFTDMFTAEWFLMPDLTVKLSGPSVVGLNRKAEYTVTVSNDGSIAADNVSVDVYVNGTGVANWSIDLGPGQVKTLNFTWIPTATGLYNMTAVVDKDNRIAEANENNNEVSMTVNVIWVGKVDVDGNPSDWITPNVSTNSYVVEDGYFIWRDAVGDQRHDKDEYLPGHTSSHADLTEVAVTKDDRYVYFLFRFANMSNIKIGENGATFIAVPIAYGNGKGDYFAGEMDTKTAIKWNFQMVINLCSNQYKGEMKAVAPAGNSKLSLLYFVAPDGRILNVSNAVVGVDLLKNTVEVRIPLSMFNGAKHFDFQVATGFSYGPAVWNFGNAFANDNIPDVVDTIGPDPTVDAFTNDVLNYYVTITMDNLIERASITNIRTEMLIEFQNAFIMHNKYFGVRQFQRSYAQYLILDRQLRNMTLSDEVKARLNEIENEVSDLLELYNEGKNSMNSPNYAFIGALRIYRAYTGMLRVVREMEVLKEKALSGEYEREEYLKELAKNLTKTIDGELNDWNVSPVAVDTENYGQDGANLKAFYMSYDNTFLYLAITTNNKASWRVVYGISLDYKPGGYTGGEDSWGKKLNFTKGIDAQLYFFWNGPFFGSPGTNTITSAQLALWENGTWKYEDLKWIGFYNYTGSAQDGLQTLEIAIPWKALGGRPKVINAVAYITGQGVGDSAVDSLPLQEAVMNNPPSKEWSDVDTFTKFATITVVSI